MIKSWMFKPQIEAAGHRYWRIYCTSTPDNYFSFQEIELRSSFGGSDLTGSGTATASQTEGGHSPTDAVDNNSGTFWGSYNGTVPQWWKYDFGSGNGHEIVEIAITSRDDQYYQEAGTNFEVQYSDNDSNWTTQKSISGLSWSQAETKVINVA